MGDGVNRALGVRAGYFRPRLGHSLRTLPWSRRAEAASARGQMICRSGFTATGSGSPAFSGAPATTRPDPINESMTPAVVLYYGCDRTSDFASRALLRTLPVQPCGSGLCGVTGDRHRWLYVRTAGGSSGHRYRGEIAPLEFSSSLEAHWQIQVACRSERKHLGPILHAYIAGTL